VTAFPPSTLHVFTGTMLSSDSLGRINCSRFGFIYLFALVQFTQYHIKKT